MSFLMDKSRPHGLYYQTEEEKNDRIIVAREFEKFQAENRIEREQLLKFSSHDEPSVRIVVAKKLKNIDNDPKVKKALKKLQSDSNINVANVTLIIWVDDQSVSPILFNLENQVNSYFVNCTFSNLFTHSF